MRLPRDGAPVHWIQHRVQKVLQEKIGRVKKAAPFLRTGLQRIPRRGARTLELFRGHVKKNDLILPNEVPQCRPAWHTAKEPSFPGRRVPLRYQLPTRLVALCQERSPPPKAEDPERDKPCKTKAIPSARWSPCHRTGYPELPLPAEGWRIGRPYTQPWRKSKNDPDQMIGAP